MPDRHYYSDSDIRNAFPKGAFKRGRRIIEKQRRCASPREGMRQSWTEWQVVDGRRVLSRHDTEKQAREALHKLAPR